MAFNSDFKLIDKDVSTFKVIIAQFMSHDLALSKSGKELFNIEVIDEKCFTDSIEVKRSDFKMIDDEKHPINE